MLFPLYDENPTQRPPIVTIAIIALNAILLAVSTWLSTQPDQLQLRQLFYKYGFVPARITQLSTGQPLQLDLDPEGPLRQLVHFTLEKSRVSVRATVLPLRIKW